ncbi:MAG: hypothetical protein LBQ39_07845 [Tannerellaceae bacterium]|jgi:hypothetical protein|nr:hypothetical protein [Tannerellaceae bacterium]
MSYTILKSEAELYTLRLLGVHMYWADIVLYESPCGGRLVIASDYGTWQHYWIGIGSRSFKKFLIDTNDENYMAEKLGATRDDEPTPQFLRFWEEVWPEFIKQIKDEEGL